MPYEVTERVQQITEYYRNYGRSIDELFEGPFVELDTAKAMIDNKVTEYYADNNDLVPTDEEINSEVEKTFAEQVTQPANSEAIKQAVIQQFGSLEKYKTYLTPKMKEQLKTENVKSAIAKVTDEEFKKYFEENNETIMKNGNQVKVAHILVDELELAEDILAQIKNGEITFSEAAVKYSTDKSNAEQGGDLDWFSEGQMVDEFTDAAFNGETGTVVGPVKTQFGYHLIDVQDKKSLSSFEDFKANTELLATAETTLQDEKYSEWLETYKTDDNFAYILNDDVLSAYDKYESMTKKGEDLSTVTLDEFTTWLEQYILIDENGTKKVDPEVDPRTTALYVTVKENINSNLSEQKSTLEKFAETAKEVSDEYKTKPVEELKTMISDREAELVQLTTDSVNLNNDVAETEKLIAEAATATDLDSENQKLVELKDKLLETNEKTTSLKAEKTLLNNAVKYAELVVELKNEKINTDDVEDVIKEIADTVTENERMIVDGLNLLYSSNTASSQVISKLYGYEPENSEVKLKWLEQQLEQYTMYLNDEEVFNQYRSFLEPQLLQLQLGLLGIAKDSEEPEDRRVAAYEDLLNLLEKWGQYEEEVTYLEELKALKADYPDIDQIIEQVKEQVTLMNAATETTSISTSTVE
jgi:parvulin-like peptidyl-prolyl isomerase